MLLFRNKKRVAIQIRNSIVQNSLAMNRENHNNQRMYYARTLCNWLLFLEWLVIGKRVGRQILCIYIHWKNYCVLCIVKLGRGQHSATFFMIINFVSRIFTWNEIPAWLPPLFATHTYMWLVGVLDSSRMCRLHLDRYIPNLPSLWILLG